MSNVIDVSVAQLPINISGEKQVIAVIKDIYIGGCAIKRIIFFGWIKINRSHWGSIIRWHGCRVIKIIRQFKVITGEMWREFLKLSPKSYIMCRRLPVVFYDHMKRIGWNTGMILYLHLVKSEICPKLFLGGVFGHLHTIGRSICVFLCNGYALSHKKNVFIRRNESFGGSISRTVQGFLQNVGLASIPENRSPCCHCPQMPNEKFSPARLRLCLLNQERKKWSCLSFGRSAFRLLLRFIG